MSRVGKKTITVPAGVTVTINGADVTVKGAKGELSWTLPTGISAAQEGDVLTVGSLRFQVLETPGHSSGSVCLICGNALFSGDTLFAGSCGRMDLPGGDPAAMQTSLARLAGAKGDYRVYPGHGGSSRLSLERQYNPYLEGLL